MVGPKLPPGSAFPEQLLDLGNFVMDAFSKDQFGGTGQTSDWDSFFQNTSHNIPIINGFLPEGWDQRILGTPYNTWI